MSALKSLKLGIIGQPLTHTLSPVLHAQLMQQLGIDGVYRKYELSPAELASAIIRFGGEGVRGLNVTIPHKVAIMGQMDWLSPEAELAGAVNTVVFEPESKHQDPDPKKYRKKGYNTDIAGFARSLPDSVVQRLPEINVLVIGAGGSARAVLTALIQLGAAAITFAVRDPEKVVRLVSDAEMIKQTYGSRAEIQIVSLMSLPSLEGYGGLINTTPVGMWPEQDLTPISALQLKTLPAGAWVYDLIYRPAETRLLKDAKAQGFHALNGLDMLIYQGICSFELWQDQPVPPEILPALRQQLMQAMAKSALSEAL
jgi:shikimate dehydrogenase